MTIANTRLINISARRSGGIRATMRYVLTDGREINIGPISVPSVHVAEKSMDDREARVLQNIQRQDAAEAVRLGITTPHKEATQGQVYFAWLYAGWTDPDALKAHDTLKMVAGEILALGLTAEQMASAFGSSVEEAEAVLARWEYLDANSASIAAYKAVAEGDV